MLRNSLKILLYAFVFLSVQLTVSYAQQDETFIIQEVLEYLIENGDEEIDYTELQDKLLRFYHKPINLNKASLFDLSELEILSQPDITAIINHRNTYGSFLSFYELQAVEGLSNDVIRLIKPFVTVDEFIDLEKLSFTKLVSRSDAFLLSRYRMYFEEQKGYTKNKIDSEDGYLGAPYQLYNRFQFGYGRRFSTGFTVEKDMGESLFNKGTSFDYKSAHFYISDIGKLKQLAIGDYQVQFGQGLHLWSGLAFNKSAQVLNISKRASGILPYRGANENLYMRGAAAAFAVGEFTLSAFYSYKKIDGNINSDTLENALESFSSFQTSGFHRTQSELEDKDAIGEQIMGFNLQRRIKTFNIGASWSYLQYDKPVEQKDKPYQLFDFAGTENQNASLYYSGLVKGVYLYGEAAWSQHLNSHAIIQGALLSLSNKIDAAICYRNYQNEYFAPYSNGFREGGSTNNESGMYIGLIYKHSSKLTFSSYFDRFKNPWLGFKSDRPSNGFEYLVDASYRKKRDYELYLRLRLQAKEENTPDNNTALDYLSYYQRKYVRFQFRYKKAQPFTFTTRLETSLFERNSDNNSGYLIYQDVAYKPSFTKISFTARYSIFNIDDFDARIYTYENDVLYGYSIPFFYRQGFRFYLLSRIRISNNIDVWLRYARTEYKNVATVGSANELSEGNSRNELKAQVRIKF